ncbi:RES family NAD+ phosphorylase [Parvibaculum sp.]|uniref:RES family NAD+ phosphorylase n=1 Tax=Parvibaculum sp. TaxID=2024848 RepID=UPI00261957AD|nr:RES family NAD+ phosphorylase [Parvibaculum sp.]MCW5728526.1 RES family NAD+ phosphorylase [Parvibaculum sp.]
MAAATIRVSWEKAHRIIRSIYPPIALFEDIAEPADWEALASAEAKRNPRVRESLGRLDLVPVARRVSGPGASLVMAPFVHCSRRRPSRFTDGSYGIYYAGNSLEVAFAETIHHHGRTMAATNEEPGWTSQFRQLICSIDQELDDVSDDPALLDPDDYAPSWAFGAARRAAGSDGFHWPSVRYPDGLCVGLLWPDVVTPPVQAGHFAYHWNGTEVDYVKQLDGTAGEVWRVL